MSNIDPAQQLSDAYRCQVDLEHWQRRSGVQQINKGNWRKAPGNMIAARLADTYMHYLQDIAIRSVLRAGKYCDLNKFIQEEETLKIGAGITLGFLLGAPWPQQKVNWIAEKIGKMLEYERWLNDPYWKNSYHLKGLGIMCAGDLGMKAVQDIMLGSKFNAAVRHYRPLEPIDKRALGKFFLYSFCESTKMMEIVSLTSPANRREEWAEFTSIYYEFCSNWRQAKELYAMRNMPMMKTPKPWTGFIKGGYESIVTRLSNIDSQEWPRVSQGLKPGVIAAVNKMQETAFVFDRPMINLVCHCHDRQLNIGGLISTPAMERPFKNSNALKHAKAMMQYKRDQRKNSKRTAYAHWRMSIAELDKRNAERLYFVNWFDRRGRVYQHGGQVSYQSMDYKRQSLSFAMQGPVKGNEAEVMYAISQAAGMKGLWGTPLSAWFDKEMERIVYCGSDPEGTVSIWSGMKEPWRYIRLAKLWFDYIQDPGLLTGIPFQLDQTTSGYGHVACLTYDQYLARATNVVGDTLSDVYSMLGQWTMQKLRNKLEKEEDPKKIRCAQWWLKERTSRTLWKKMFMPLIYGAGFDSVNEAVMEMLADEMTFFVEDGLRVQDLSVFLASIGLAAAREAMPGVNGLYRWMRDVSAVYLAAKQRPCWVTPMGLTVFSALEKTGRSGGVEWIYGGRKIRENRMTKRGYQVSLGVAADFVHSYDSAFLHQFVSAWPHAIVTVHDCFATTVDKVAIMRAELRDQWSRFYSVDHLSQLHGYVQTLTGRNVPPPPRVGTLQPGLIGENHWLFS